MIGNWVKLICSLNCSKLTYRRWRERIEWFGRGDHGKFRVRTFYEVVQDPSGGGFPWGAVWKNMAPQKIYFNLLGSSARENFNS